MFFFYINCIFFRTAKFLISLKSYIVNRQFKCKITQTLRCVYTDTKKQTDIYINHWTRSSTPYPMSYMSFCTAFLSFSHLYSLSSILSLQGWPKKIRFFLPRMLPLFLSGDALVFDSAPTRLLKYVSAYIYRSPSSGRNLCLIARLIARRIN